MKDSQGKPINKLRWILSGLLAIAVIIAVVLMLQPGATGALPATINVQQANSRIANGAYLLDVRQPSEWDQAHVKGAVLIPLDQLSARINEVLTNQDVLIICHSGNRSAQARDLLRAAGLERTTSIDGGITAWMAAGLPVVSGP